MGRIAYVNGRYVPHREARVHIEDRGMQFADAAYEVIAVIGGRLVDLPWHLERLSRSTAALGMAVPMSGAALSAVLHETARRNRVRDGLVYVQAGRGAAPRDHAFPARPDPSLVVAARRARPDAGGPPEGVRVVTAPDLRWKRCDIKSVALLPNVLAKQQARAAGAFEAWLVDERGFVTEGTSSNAWIVDAGGAVRTRPPGPEILAGVTRRRLIALAREAGIEVVESTFTPGEAKRAREAFLTSTSSFVIPVTGIDDAVVANGRPGATAERLAELYRNHARAA